MTGHKRDQSDLSIVEHDLDALTRNARTLGEGSTDSASSAGSKSPFDIREHYNSYIQDPASAQPSSATAQQFPEPEALAHVPRCLAPSHISYEPNTYTASPHSLSRGESSRNSAPSYRSDELPVGAEAGNYAQWFQRCVQLHLEFFSRHELTLAVQRQPTSAGAAFAILSLCPATA